MNSASPGDVIIVDPGTYTEDVLINGKSNLLIRSSDGPANTIVAATENAAANNSTTNIITIRNSNNIAIQGLTVTGAGLDKAGIQVEGSVNCRLEDNILHDDALGIQLRNSHYTTIRNNIATKTLLSGLGRAINIEQSNYATVSGNTISNQRYGISLTGSSANTISGNAITQSSSDSIRVESSSNNNRIENNTASSSGSNGIYLSSSSSNNLKNNSVSISNNNGIYLVLSAGNTILDNKVDSGSQHDIMLDNSSSNNLTNNIVSGSPYGIAVRYSNNNILTSNNAYSNNQGLYITLTSTNNTLSRNKANSNTGSGISLYRVSGNTLQSNEVTSNTNFGIILDNSSNNKVFNNIASKNSRGISLTSSSSENELSGNSVNLNTYSGITLDNSSDNELIHNTAGSNNNYGIYLTGSGTNDLTSNTASGNDYGIYILASNGNTISENMVYNNAVTASSIGILLRSSNTNTVNMNKVFKNPYGISLSSSRDNNISSNSVTLSTNGFGLSLCPQSTNNLIFNNYLNNSQNVDTKNNQSEWNVPRTSGKNIMGRSDVGGNCWADPVLKDDYSQTAADANQDGFADLPYSGENFIDNLPLMEGNLITFPNANFGSTPSGLSVVFNDQSQDATSRIWDFGDGTSSVEQNPTHIYTAAGTYNVKLTAINTYGMNEKTAVITVQQDQGGNDDPGNEDPENGSNVLPVADFSTSVTGGYAPLSVTFTDLSKNATSRNWDFGDGTSSVDQNPTHIYSAAGTYTVTLTAYNNYGPATKTAQIIVDRESSGGSGGSGGGGGGGSPEPARNVEVKELSQVFITNGKPIKFDFTKNATCVVYVGFDAKKTVGKTTTIAEQLKNKSSLVSSLPEGEEVYKYFNVWVGNSGFATSKNIEKPTICFKVEKSWVQDKKIDQSSIALNRYNDKKWEQLPASLLKEDSKYLYFTADVPGYTFFAVTGKANTASEEVVTDIEPDNKPDNSKDNAGDTGSAASTESNAGDNKSMPGFEIVCGIAGLSAAFLYRRK